MTPGPWTVAFEPSYKQWVVRGSNNHYICACTKEADARALVALPALQNAMREVLYIAERNEVLTNHRGGQHVGNSPTMQRSQAIELLKIARAALAQADGPAPKE